ncbi:hypothetical protein ACFFWD_35590 [Bradyrhizobium erythrophlei]|uniref:hypothetical protein n=1 Tax=Bradyrhizobium erythrophlei TaxID=1437360 RepID=UPI0035E4E04D
MIARIFRHTQDEHSSFHRSITLFSRGLNASIAEYGRPRAKVPAAGKSAGNGYDRRARMKLLIVLATAVSLSTVAPTVVYADDVNLAPTYQPHPETDSERLQNFRVPSPPPTSYPNVSGGDRGDPRLNINRDVSLGGNVSPHSVEGNVRFPIPGRH